MLGLLSPEFYETYRLRCFTTLREVVSTNLIDSDIIMKTQVEKDLSFKNKEHLAPCKNEHI